MNDDLMRLSDLVPAYVRCYKVSTQEAGYALHELIEELYVEYGVNQWLPNSVNNFFGSESRGVRSALLGHTCSIFSCLVSISTIFLILQLKSIKAW